jgi:predicted DNA-binding transcriptional regulator AlpA
MELEYYITVNQVRAHMGDVARSTIYKWVKDGKFPAPTKVGSVNLWSVRAIQDHMEQPPP